MFDGMLKNIFFTSVLTLTGCLFFAPVSGASSAPSLTDFFRPAPDSGRELPSNELYPKGRTLMYSLYSVKSPEQERLKNDGFTCIGPYYGDQQQQGVLSRAESTGLKCFYSIGEKIDFLGDYAMPSDGKIRRSIAEDINAASGSPSVSAWNLVNEELRHWKPDEMHWLEVATQEARRLDPLKRPVMMYDPKHRNAAALSQTVKYLDFSSKGTYVNTTPGMKDNRIWVRWSIEQEIEAIRTANTDATPLAILWMAQDPDDPAEDALIDDWTRHDVYLSMVTGAKGVAIWSGWNRRPGFERTFSTYYQGYADVAAELNGELGLADVFLFGEPRNDFSVSVKSGTDTIHLVFNEDEAFYPSISHLDIAYENDRYLFLVNSAQETVVADVLGLPESGVLKQDLLSGSETAPLDGGSFEVTLPMLGVQVYRFTKASPSGAYIELR